MKTKAEIVEEMLNTLNSPEKWCKNILERMDDDGTVQRCLIGALNLSVYGTALGSYAATTAQGKEYRSITRTMDHLALEKGYINPYYSSPARPNLEIGVGAHAVEFNNAVETEYEDIRMFLKELLERVS